MIFPVFHKCPITIYFPRKYNFCFNLFNFQHPAMTDSFFRAEALKPKFKNIQENNEDNGKTRALVTGLVRDYVEDHQLNAFYQRYMFSSAFD